MNKIVTNARITRWILLLQEFNITIIDRPGKDNLIVDFFPDLCIQDKIHQLMIIFLMRICFLYLLMFLGVCICG
jgi:hypothetical protein